MPDLDTRGCVVAVVVFVVTGEFFFCLSGNKEKYVFIYLAAFFLRQNRANQFAVYIGIRPQKTTKNASKSQQALDFASSFFTIKGKVKIWLKISTFSVTSIENNCDLCYTILHCYLLIFYFFSKLNLKFAKWFSMIFTF